MTVNDIAWLERYSTGRLALYGDDDVKRASRLWAELPAVVRDANLYRDGKPMGPIADPDIIWPLLS